MADPFVGSLTFFRVYSGGAQVRRVRVQTPPPAGASVVGRILKMHANKREEIDEVCAGDIAAAVGLRSAKTGDTLCDEANPILLESIDFPETRHRHRHRTQVP